MSILNLDLDLNMAKCKLTNYFVFYFFYSILTYLSIV